MNSQESVKIVEVGPRDGLQNVETLVNTDDKIKLIEKLIATNMQMIEITSFVNPKYVPQMADADEIVGRSFKEFPNMQKNFIGLALNERGVERAYNTGLEIINYNVSASNQYSLKNSNRSTIEATNDFIKIVNDWKNKANLNLNISAIFGSPFEGEEIDLDVIKRIVVDSKEAGANKIVLSDTVGFASPLQMKNMIHFLKEYIDVKDLGIHLHDNQGMGLASSVAAYKEGIRLYETSIAGLGGSPFAPNATGNISTEDLVNLFHNMDIETGINLNKLLEVSLFVQKNLDLEVRSNVFNNLALNH
jgi:hydroxymethylglutaryl-CoA lyase